jgi:hypothetical protein
MIKHYMEGLLFFEGGRELRVVAYDVSRTSAVVHSDGLGLLPIVVFDPLGDLGLDQRSGEVALGLRGDDTPLVG